MAKVERNLKQKKWNHSESFFIRKIFVRNICKKRSVIWFLIKKKNFKEFPSTIREIQECNLNPYQRNMELNRKY